MTTVIAEYKSATDVRPTTPHAHPLTRLLSEFESLLHLIPVEAYTTVAEPGQPTIAHQVEGCLDVIESLTSEHTAAIIASGTPADRGVDLGTSLQRIKGLQKALVNWPRSSPDAIRRVSEPVGLLILDEPVWSTLDIELAFAVNRIVDRQKIIDRATTALGLMVPRGFGSMELQPLRARSSVPPAWELWRLLDELDSVLSEVSPDLYCDRFVAEVSGSIGEHVRHCLDHVSALLSADASATLSYERRQRGTAVETDPAQAVRQILQLKRGIESWSRRALDEPIRVTSMISPAGDAVTGWSTLARELAFVISHTIHHQAIVGLLLAVHGHEVPEQFGHSPSTPRRN